MGAEQDSFSSVCHIVEENEHKKGRAGGDKVRGYVVETKGLRRFLQGLKL